ncbi:MAG: MBOAT family O-acyltransferase [Planctomycetota bacterium]
MLFVEFRFLFFFAAVLAVNWALRWNTARKVWLLGASYAFYAGWDWRFLGLILFSTLVDYCAGAGIGRNEGNRTRQRAWLGLSLAGNLGLLGTYKYFDFFSTTAQDFLGWLGIGASLPVLNLVLPVGISFYTFQTLSYSIDIYLGKLKPARSLLDLALFVGFFPQLVAGPIVMAKEFLPQLNERRTLGDVRVRWALILFFVGFVKKSCISDGVSPFVDAVHAAPEAATAFAVWVSAFAFSCQIYCDFSGYTDMAIACAMLLGYRLPINFNAPYLSRSIGEFWKRWHVTLGRWFFEYVYVPMGGNRCGKLRSMWNLWFVFVASGLWHGAGLTYVVYGMIYGTVVIFERMPFGQLLRKMPSLVQMAYVHFVWMVTMTLFRSPDIGHAAEVCGRMLTGLPSAAGESPPVPPLLIPTLAVLGAVHVIWQKAKLEERWSNLPPEAFAAVMGVAVALATPWISSNPAPYIYFAF